MRSSRSSARSRSSPTWRRRARALGMIYLEQGRLDEAERALRRELSARPNDTTAQHRLAAVLELQGRSTRRLLLLRQVLKARPDFAQARYLFGKILLAQGCRRAGGRAARGGAARGPEGRQHPLPARPSVPVARPRRGCAQGVRGVPAAQGPAARALVMRTLLFLSCVAAFAAGSALAQTRPAAAQPKPAAKRRREDVKPPETARRRAGPRRRGARGEADRRGRSALCLGGRASRSPCGRCWGSRGPQSGSGEPRPRAPDARASARALAPNSEEVLERLRAGGARGASPGGRDPDARAARAHAALGDGVPLSARCRADAGRRHAERRRSRCRTRSRSSRTAR